MREGQRDRDKLQEREGVNQSKKRKEWKHQTENKRRETFANLMIFEERRFFLVEIHS